MKWFRFYEEVLEDPKVQKLSGDMFKVWVNLLCLASKNDGVLPPKSDIAFALRCNENTVTEALDFLIKANLLAVTKNQHGETLSPHNWKKRQYKSDTSADRVKRYRERKKTVTCNVTVTPPEAESETEQNRAEAEGPPPMFSEKELKQFRKQCPSLTDREFKNHVFNCETWIRINGAKTPEVTLSKWLQDEENKKPQPRADGLNKIREAMQ